jgi:hypothetical protein
MGSVAAATDPIIPEPYCGIYLAKTQSKAETYRNEHQKLVTRLSEKGEAQEIVKLRSDLEQLLKNIKKQLEKYIEMEQVPGRCEFCAPQ